jgi:ubiquinone/menaquinone biosynthesis C-methylase UbiE
VLASNRRRRPRVEVRRRYTAADVGVLTEEEAKRFASGETADPRTDPTLAWELLYRLEPELYERLVAAESLHPGVLAWLPSDAERTVEVAAGTGRLTLELVKRAREVLAIEPAEPLREILSQKLSHAEHGARARVAHGFFDELPVADDYADLVVACSALTPVPGHGGEAGLAEMERVCRPGGCVVIVWPNHVPWLAANGYRHVSFDDDEMFVEFASHREAAELTEIFYPHSREQVLRHRWRRVPYEALGVNPPRDLAYKLMAR